MWAVGLVLLALTDAQAGSLDYCQELILRGSALRKDVATLVVTMDGTCAVCYEEVQKLATLKTQMARLGHSVDVLVALDHLPQDRNHLPFEVTVDLEDAWAKLGRLNGHLFVFDKCGKLAYHVITPWSRQIYPFTAMAGLSALYDAPCGECNTTNQVLEELQDELFGGRPDRNDSNWDLVTMDLQANQLPLTITIPGKHQHVVNGSRVIYDGLELRTNDSNYHGHGDRVSESVDDTQNQTTHVNPAGSSKLQDNISSTVELPQNPQDYRDLLKRYQPLMKWRSCANLIMSIQVDIPNGL